MIKAIIFDMGGVIINFKEIEYYQYLSKKYKLNINYLENLFDPLIDQMDEGNLKLNDALELISKKLKITRKQMHLEWISGFKKTANINSNVINLIRHLSLNYYIYLLTNVNISRYLTTRKEFLNGNSNIFNKKFISCYIHLRKPDSRIYKYVLNKIKLNADEILFIDDMKTNVGAAVVVGMNGIVFKNCNQLNLELKKLKIMI